MITKHLNRCTAIAIQNKRVTKMIENRERDRNTRISSINSSIIKNKGNKDFFKMLVRIGIDFNLRVENENIKEDILIDISFVLNRRTGAETFDILNITSIPEFE